MLSLAPVHSTYLLLQSTVKIINFYLNIQFEHLEDCEYYEPEESQEVCQEKVGLARLDSVLGCLPFLFVRDQNSSYCVGGSIGLNKTKLQTYRTLIKVLENYHAGGSCLKVE